MLDLRTVGIVYTKELLETLRDRRTLVVMVALPLCLYPIVGIGITKWIGAHEADRVEQVSRVAVRGASWQRLTRALDEAPKIELVPKGANDGALRQGKVDAVVVVPGDHQQQLARDGTVKLEVRYDGSEERSRQARHRVDRSVHKLSRQLLHERLKQRELPRSLVKPLALKDAEISKPGARGAQLISGTVPILVILMVLLGAFYPAIDVTAGEKERGTLETLLVSPADRTSLVAGKYLVVATTAVITGLLNLCSIGITLAYGFGPALKQAGLAPQSMPWGVVALTVVAMVPSALLFAALMVAIAALARSFKEAQNLLTPVYMACMLPAMAAQLPGLKLDVVTALIPVVNVSLLTRDLITGKVQLLPALLSIGSVLLYTVLALRLAGRVFESERLLFAADPGRGPKKRGLLAILRGNGRPAHPAEEPAEPKGGDAGDDPRGDAGGADSAAAPGQQRSGPGGRRGGLLPSAGQAALLLAAVMAAILLIGQPLQLSNMVSGLVVTEWLLIALPVLLLVRLGGLSPRHSLALRRPPPGTMVGAFLVGISAWYLVGVLVQLVQQRLFPMPEEMIRQFHEALFLAGRPLALDLFILAISPAICEELLFRGALLQATRTRMGPLAAVLLNGLLFGLFHMNPYRFLSTAILGMLLALIVLRVGSILPSMVFHFLNNASALVVARLSGEQSLREVASETPINWPMVAGACVMVAAGLALALRARAAGYDWRFADEVGSGDSDDGVGSGDSDDSDDEVGSGDSDDGVGNGDSDDDEGQGRGATAGP